jgi:hypothetical protein
MSNTDPAARWQDKTITRGELVRNGGLIALGLAAAAVTKPVVEHVEEQLLYGPHWGADWHVVEEPAAKDMPLVRFAGHPEWLRLSDRLYHVGIMAAGRLALDAQAANLPGSEHAVAWRRNNWQIEVGTYNISPPAIVDKPDTYPEDYVIGMGVGKADLYATMGLWQEDEQRFTPAQDVRTLGQVTTYDMAERYPQVHWV